ncbi:MAG: AAA family ATPase [Chloroflexi bacterium]|nr:AAA family ATPase [Chloroflexota bacterium]
MYKSFRVKNFRCFKDLQINDLGRVNLIAGKNNTGKTALLEAISVYCGDRRARTLLRSDLQYLGHSSSVELGSSSVIDVDSIFYDFNMESNVEMCADTDSSAEDTWNGKPLSICRVETDTEEYEKVWGWFYSDTIRKARFAPFVEYQPTEAIRLAYDNAPETFIYFVVANGELHLSRYTRISINSCALLWANVDIQRSATAKQFSAIRQAKGISALVNSLRVLEPRLEDLELLYDGHQPLIFADIGLSKLIPLAHLGEGINRLVGILLALGELPEGIVLIDEIENGIHHSVQKDVWKAIGQVARDLDIQVFATTHSLEMIRAAYEAFTEAGNLEDFRYHRLDRSRKTGEIRATTYNELDMEAVAAFDFDHEVR